MTRISACCLLGFLLTVTHTHAVAAYWMGSWYSVKASFRFARNTDASIPPEPKDLKMPAYPIDMVNRNLSGHAVIEFHISETGEVSSLLVVDKSETEFSDVALKTVQTWQFTPGIDLKTRKPVAVSMRCRFSFDMDEDAEGPK